MTGARFGHVDATPLNARLADALSARRWRIRLPVQDLRLEVLGSRDRRFEVGETLARLLARIDGVDTILTAPVALFDLVLARAPEATSLKGLDPQDAALLLEHVLSEPLDALEARLGMPVMLDRIEPGQEVRGGGAWFEVDLGDRIVPVHVQVGNEALAAELASAVFELDRIGPGGVPGMPVAIGPVKLARGDVEALVAGDELLLEGATLDRLSGAVLLDDRFYWPIVLVDGGVVIDGSLNENIPGRDGEVGLFFIVGVTTEVSAMRLGDRMPLQRVEERRMLLRHGDRVLGRAGLVNLPDGLAIRFFGRDGL